MKLVHTGIRCVFLFFALFSCNTAKKEATKSPGEEVPIVVTEDIEAGIKANIAQKVKEGDGYFRMKDKNGEELRLELVRVHTEYLAHLGPGSYFACVDLADISGDVYDVDFFMEGDPDQMQVTEYTLHKLNGKPFYSWQQKNNTWERVPVNESSSKLLGVIEGKDRFEFRYDVTLPKITEAGEIWIPVPKSDEFQTVDLVKLNVPGKYQMLKDEEFGNDILYMKLLPEHSGKEMELVYAVEREEKNPYEAEAASGEYLEPDLLLPVNERFRNLADSAIAGKRGDNGLMKARAIYDYIIDNMRYMKFGTFGTGDAVYACDALTGNCTEFHSLFISMARSKGIPARFAIGAAIPSERDEGGVDGYHCWAEFYAEGKWWPVDISEANKYTALATYYFGRHPANRIEFSRGRDLVVKPGPKSGPINFLAYPVLEVNGKPATAKTFFSFNRKRNPDHG